MNLSNPTIDALLNNASGERGIIPIVGHPASWGMNLKVIRCDLRRWLSPIVDAKPRLLIVGYLSVLLSGTILGTNASGNANNESHYLVDSPSFKFVSYVDITAYTWKDAPAIDWGSFHETIHEGSIAISRDLEKFIHKDDLVYVEGYGVYTVKDRMAKTWTRRLDIYFHDQKEAKEFGIHKRVRVFKITLPRRNHWKGRK